MKFLKSLVIGIAALALLVIGVGFLLPSTAHVSRSVTVSAAPASVYAALNGFRQFNRWSPWADLATDTKYVYSGPLQGPGARMEWSSADPNVGAGSQQILASLPYQSVEIELKFEGFAVPSRSTHTLTPVEGGGTQLEWSFDTDFGRNLFGRYMGLMIGRYIGADYEKGLGRFKTFIETLPPARFPETEIAFVEANATPLAMLSGTASAAESAQLLGEAYGRILAFMAEAGLQQAGAPLAITRSYDDATGAWKFDAAIPLDRECTAPEAGDIPGDTPGDIHCGSSYAGAALKLSFSGPVSNTPASYAALTAYRDAAGLTDNGDSWEHYVTDPSASPEGQLTMDIYWPVK